MAWKHNYEGGLGLTKPGSEEKWTLGRTIYPCGEDPQGRGDQEWGVGCVAESGKPHQQGELAQAALWREHGDRGGMLKETSKLGSNWL